MTRTNSLISRRNWDHPKYDKMAPSSAVSAPSKLQGQRVRFQVSDVDNVENMKVSSGMHRSVRKKEGDEPSFIDFVERGNLGGYPVRNKESRDPPHCDEEEFGYLLPLQDETPFQLTPHHPTLRVDSPAVFPSRFSQSTRLTTKRVRFQLNLPNGELQHPEQLSDIPTPNESPSTISTSDADDETAHMPQNFANSYGAGASLYSVTMVSSVPCHISSRYRLKAMERWGIPCPSGCERVDILDRIMDDRLIWIRYRDNRYWWPAIVYKNYKEIIDSPSLTRCVWNHMSIFRKMELAGLLVYGRPDHPRKDVLVARVLGKSPNSAVELVEVEEYWPMLTDARKVQSILSEMALSGDYFRKDPDLYFDWHRALDETESLLVECNGDRYYGCLQTLYRQNASRTLLVPNPPSLAKRSLSESHHPHVISMNQVDETNSIVASTTCSLMNRENYRSWLERAQKAERRKWKRTLTNCHDAFVLSGCCGDSTISATNTGSDQSPSQPSHQVISTNTQKLPIY